MSSGKIPENISEPSAIRIIHAFSNLTRERALQKVRADGPEGALIWAQKKYNVMDKYHRRDDFYLSERSRQ